MSRQVDRKRTSRLVVRTAGVSRQVDRKRTSRLTPAVRQDVGMTLTVHLFARGRELAGADAVAVELSPGATVGDVRRVLAARHPALASLLERSAIAVNHDFAEDDRVLNPGDEVAIIPPVSGG